MAKEWIDCKDKLPPEGEIVLTKIDDCEGVRNIQNLMHKRDLWWHPDGRVYVYYSPTHWKIN